MALVITIVSLLSTTNFNYPLILHSPLFFQILLSAHLKVREFSCSGRSIITVTIIIVVLYSNKVLLYRGKLLREKTFANFAVLLQFAKVFSTKFESEASFGMAKQSNPRKFSLQKFHQFAKVFSLDSFPLYGITNFLLFLGLLILATCSEVNTQLQQKQ